ncbi:MAG: hypothetical protein ABL924_10460 [Methyloglobulus sp.]
MVGHHKDIDQYAYCHRSILCCLLSKKSDKQRQRHIEVLSPDAIYENNLSFLGFPAIAIGALE